MKESVLTARTEIETSLSLTGLKPSPMFLSFAMLTFDVTALKL